MNTNKYIRGFRLKQIFLIKSGTYFTSISVILLVSVES
ncbi:MAG: hypothetical protein DDT30_01439 [Dehalococcoidia bacterium]|nr:hypothetical protein [Bacillota bacterium]